MRRNILVADDDKHVQELVKLFLEQSGYVVKVCRDGYSLRDELLGHYFDMAILDIYMPFGNGLKMLADLRNDEKFKDLPVLMLTMSTEKDHIARAKSLGVSDYVIKPPQRDDLINRVSRILGARPQFEEVQILDGESKSQISAVIDITLKSISNVGMVIESRFPMPAGEKLSFLKFDILEKLKIKDVSYRINQCNQTKDAKFEYFVSFMDLRKEQQDALREWIISESFSRKKP